MYLVFFKIIVANQYSNEEVIKAYVRNQGMEKAYKKVHSEQLKLF